jgi:hypothetical protein
MSYELHCVPYSQIYLTFKVKIITRTLAKKKCFHRNGYPQAVQLFQCV